MDDTRNERYCKSEVSTKKNEQKREKRNTAESILVQRSGAALAVLPDRRRRPCQCNFHIPADTHICKLSIPDWLKFRLLK